MKVPKLGNQRKLMAITSMSMLLATMATILQPVDQRAYAATCTPFNHCWAIEREEGLTNYGNEFTTIISDLTLSDYCNNFITVEQWIAFPNGDWIEMGTMVGKNPTSGTCYSSERTFSAKMLSGAYAETTHSGVTVGNQYTYEISDTNKDKTWLVKRGATQLTTITVTHANGVGMDVGAETTVDSGLPKTHLWDISWYKSSNAWEYWGLADFIGESPSSSPLWILNCTPNYQHIHVGSGSAGNCT